MFRVSLATLALSAFATFGTAAAVGQDNPGQDNPRSDATNPAQAGQQAGQQPGQQVTEQYQARRVPLDAGRQGITVTEALIKKLKKGNDAEIELAKLAQQKTQDQELRQFTQMVIQDHEAFNQKLDQASQGNQGATSSARTTGRTEQPDAADRTARNRENRAENRAENRQAGERPAGERPAGERPAGERQVGAGAMRANLVPEELCKVMEQACENSLQMTKQMLEEKDGQDFQMCYLGQQIVAHTMMIAELKAIESEGPTELQQIVQQALPKTEAHLEHAKQLAKKFGNKEAGTTSPTRR